MEHEEVQSEPQAQQPQPKKPGRSRRTAALIAAAVGGVAIAAAAGGLIYAGQHAPLEPLAHFVDDGIPPKVSALHGAPFDTLLDPPGAPEVFLDAALAEKLCGGTDLASELLQVRSKDLSQLESEGLLSLLSRPKLREQLECGQKLRKAAEGGSYGSLSFQDGGEEHTVLLLRAPALTLALPKHRFSGLDGFCEQAEGESDCLSTGQA